MSTIQNYELYIVFNPQTEAEACESKINLFLNNIKAINIDIVREGVRRLAYPIRHHKNGLYYLVNFDLELADARNINTNLIKYNQDDAILRYMAINITDFLIQKSKEKLNPSPETDSHRDLNKGKLENKKCISRYLGIREIDYKDVEYLNQFTSPYSKIFPKTKTGSSAKFQRKIALAIKRARHMALVPFTAKYLE